MRWAVSDLPPALRRQAEEKLRDGAAVRTHKLATDEDSRRMPRSDRKLPRPRLTRNKFGAKCCVYEGIRFDSLKEAERWRQLRIMEQGGLIHDLRHHVPYPLLVNGQSLGVYEADFVYRDVETAEVRVEDCKGYKKGAVYRLFQWKKKLMLACNGVDVVEI